MFKKAFVPAFILAAALLPSLGFAGLASAVDESISISVSPAQQRLLLEPGEIKTAEITVINSGTVRYEAKVYATAYAISPDYSTNAFDGEGEVFSQIYRWITFDGGESSEPFMLEPGEKKTIEFTVSVPQSAAAGGQYAGIMAEIVPSSDASGVVPIRRVASLLYANINGETINNGEVVDRVWQQLYFNQDIKTSLTVKNRGNTDFAVSNRLLITNLFGGQVDEVIESPQIIFPDTSRDFELNWQSGSSIGIYRLTQQSYFLEQTVEETKLVFIMPAWFIVSILVIIVILIMAIIIGVKKRGNRRRRKYGR